MGGRSKCPLADIDDKVLLFLSARLGAWKRRETLQMWVFELCIFGLKRWDYDMRRRRSIDEKDNFACMKIYQK